MLSLFFIMWYHNYMKYRIQGNKINIDDLSEFNIEHILECGQIFTYNKNKEKDYDVYSLDKFAHIVETKNNCVIETKDTKYFVDFFDLDSDYTKIKMELKKDELVKDAVNYGYGIRILKQSLIEVIFGFIISSNNQIPRIKKIMASLREKGIYMGNYYAFPSIDKLAQISENEYREIGSGFRAKYLHSTANALLKVDLEETKNWDTLKLKSWLLSLMGVGPKVANCILLFGYHRCDSFPVDTWIEKVYVDLFHQKKSKTEMEKDLVGHFKSLSGYAQQYLFFYKRSYR